MSHVLSFCVIAAGLLGLVIPHVQAILQKPLWSPRVKSLLTVAISAILGLISYAAANGFGWIGTWDAYEIIAWIMGVYAASALIYARLLRPVGSTDYLETQVNGDGSVASDRNRDNPS
jgi:hypothetical protein